MFCCVLCVHTSYNLRICSSLTRSTKVGFCLWLNGFLKCATLFASCRYVCRFSLLYSSPMDSFKGSNDADMCLNLWIYVTCAIRDTWRDNQHMLCAFSLFKSVFERVFKVVTPTVCLWDFKVNGELIEYFLTWGSTSWSLDNESLIVWIIGDFNHFLAFD